ncbi:hypothetical protein Tco_1450657, partial [Tanacetum coccineum]
MEHRLMDHYEGRSQVSDESRRSRLIRFLRYHSFRNLLGICKGIALTCSLEVARNASFALYSSDWDESLLPSDKRPLQVPAPSFRMKDRNLEGTTSFFRHSKGTPVWMSCMGSFVWNSSTLGHVIGEFINEHGESVVIGMFSGMLLDVLSGPSLSPETPT